jgi:LCP family protein required for cell wall assembly
MHAGQEAPQRTRSPFAAAVLSLLFPGLGHAYAGAPARALAFASLPILILALGAGMVVRLDLLALGGLAIQSEFLTGVFVVNLLALAYRAAAVVDAWRVAHYLNALERAGGGRLGRPRIAVQPVSAIGLAVVLLVTSGAHLAVARWDLLLARSADCVFDPDRTDCAEASPSPGSSASPSPTEEPEASPTLSEPPLGTAVPSQTVAPWNGTERLNILLIGSDEQGGGHNTDTLIVVSIDPQSKRVAMFTLPRDTVDVPIPPGPARQVYGSVYRGKINSFFLSARNRPDAFPGTDQTRGYNALKSVLGELYGLDVKYFVEVNFEGFERVVDAFGGVNINVQMPVTDDHFPLGGGRNARIYLPSGPRHMTGAEALIYARSRNGSNDFDRGQRQQRVLLSLRQQVDIRTILPRLDSLAAAVTSAVRTDFPRDLVDELLGLADAIDTRELRSYVFTPPRYQREVLSGDPRGYVIIPDVDRIRAAVRDAFVIDPEEEARRETLAEEAASIWVLNGSGEQGEASRIAAYLEWVGLLASAPNTRPDDAGRSATRIIANNGAELAAPTTAEVLRTVFGVEIVPVADPAARVDFVVTTGTATPDLTPPPRP